MERRVLWLVLAGLVGCAEGGGGGDAPPDAASPGPDVCCSAADAHEPDAGPGADAGRPGAVDAGAPVDAAALPEADAASGPDAGAPEDLDLAGGEVAGRWCGAVTARDTLTVPAGQTLTICAGTSVRFEGSPGASLLVLGTLVVRGTAEQPVTFGGAWRGLRVGGTLDAEHVVITDAANGLESADGADVQVRHGRFERCQTALVLAGGGTFSHTAVIGGDSLTLTGGLLRMTDSVLDLGHPEQSPDCTRISGGGLALDHVRFTGCHCPLHIDRAPDGVEVTASILDGAANPVMIAQTTGRFTGNHLIGAQEDFLDIGGGFSVDIAGNYYGGDAPRLGSRDRAQFQHAEDWSMAPLEGVGPRP
ncbi:MAG: hypothetical protein R3F60_01820 [bacterium]